MAIVINRGQGVGQQGYGQVEPNHLSAQRTAQIYAQLPAAASIDVLENGQYVKYDMGAKIGGAPNDGEVNFTGNGEWMMVFNEVKLYDDRWRESYKDFAMKKENYTQGEMVPRVIKTNVGDMYTTNALVNGTYNLREVVTPDPTTGFLKVGTGAMEWEIVGETTLPDGQPAVKLMRIK